MYSIKLHRDLINKLFPFFIHLNKELEVVDCGDSLKKLLPEAVGKNVDSLFFIQRPSVSKIDQQSLQQVTNMLAVIKLKDKFETSLRGQFEYLKDEERFLFIGSPWFSSIEQLTDTRLNLGDFAYHDQQIDLLHLIKSQDITTSDLKQLLTTISKQKNDLIKNEQRLRVLSQIAEDNVNAVVIADAEGRITWANKSFSAMTGYSADEYVGKKPGHLLQGKNSDPQTVAYLKYQINHALAFNAEILNYSKDGKEYWVRVQGQPIVNEKNELTGFFAIEENITRERAIQNQLIESERKLRVSLEKIGDNVWEHDFKTNCTVFSKTNNEFIGNDAHGDNAERWWSHVHKDDRHLLEENDKKIRAGEVDSHNLRYRMVHDNGSVRWVLDRGVVIEKDDSGLPLKIIGTHTDISKIKETEAELASRVSQFKSLSENIPAVIYEYVFRKDGSHGMRYVSPSMESVFGIPAEEFKTNPEKFVHPDDAERIAIGNEKSRSTLQPFTIEARFVLANGKTMWHQASSSFAQKTEEGDLIFTGIMLNTTDRKNAEDALRLNEEKYRNIISNMNLGLLEVTAEEIITFANESFAKLTGYSIEEMMGKKASELFLVDRKDKGFIRQKSDMRKQGFSDAYEILIYDRHKNPRWVMISGAPRYNDKGDFIGSIGIHFDITEQKRLEELLVKAKEDALELAKAKELFLANMSHEIRTPLNAIIGMVRELKHTSLDSNQLQLVKNADASSSHLLSLVNNVLDLSKINSGNFELDKSDFRWSDLFDEVKSITQKSASDKVIDLIFENTIEVREQFNGDAGRIRQILINVIGNAIKFTEQGYVRVSCKKAAQVNSQAGVIISITDTGIGMDTEFIKSIFEKFTQENNSIQRKHGGTGLGMSITKQLVELMNGRIEVFSEPKKGTHFNIHLWLEQAAPAADAGEEETIEVSLEGKRILVVEDNEMNRLVAKSLLIRNKMEVTFAENGLIAIEQLKIARFDLILMDLQMPVMDGLGATVRIRQMNIATPIIALTANAFKAEIDHALQSGMNDFVSKPFDENTLLHKMKLAISKSKNIVSANGEGQQHTTANSVATTLIDENYLDSLSDCNQEFKREIFKLFRSQSQNFMEQADKLLDTNNLQEFGRLAHQFKPQGSYLGANQLTQIVALIERECKLGHDRNALRKNLQHASELITKINDEINLKLN